MTLRDRIKRHEGKRNTPYRDSLGVLSVGYGRNLEAVPFTDHEIEILFETDMQRAILSAQTFDVYEKLNEARKGVIVEMCFQMGRAGVAKFKKFLEAATQQDWEAAENAMQSSLWAVQTPQRAKLLAGIFKRGIVDDA